MDMHTKRKVQVLFDEIEELDTLIKKTWNDPDNPQLIFARRLFEDCRERRKRKLAFLEQITKVKAMP